MIIIIPFLFHPGICYLSAQESKIGGGINVIFSNTKDRYDHPDFSSHLSYNLSGYLHLNKWEFGLRNDLIFLPAYIVYSRTINADYGGSGPISYFSSEKEIIHYEAVISMFNTGISTGYILTTKNKKIQLINRVQFGINNTLREKITSDSLITKNYYSYSNTQTNENYSSVTMESESVRHLIDHAKFNTFLEFNFNLCIGLSPKIRLDINLGARKYLKPVYNYSSEYIYDFDYYTGVSINYLIFRNENKINIE